MYIIIEAKIGNLLSEPVDAIVCSANNWLVLGTGIAMEIRVAGGPEIQKECDAIIERNQGLPLPLGIAVLTGAGKLTDSDGHRRYIIHAIGVGYKEKDKIPQGRILATPTTVANAVRNALIVAKSV